MNQLQMILIIIVASIAPGQFQPAASLLTDSSMMSGYRVPPQQIDLVHELNGSLLSNAMLHGLNDKPLFGAQPGRMICVSSRYEKVASGKYRITSRFVPYSAGRWNRGPCEIPTYTDQLISVRVTDWNGVTTTLR